MPRIVTYLTKDIVQELKKISENSRQPLSKIVAELVEVGYKIKKHQREQNINPVDARKEELISNHTEYLLKIMAVTNDIYRCIRNNKSKYTENKVDDVFTKINTNVKNLINSISENQEE